MTVGERWEKVMTKQGGREVIVPNLIRYVPTGVIYVRMRFGRDGIPRLFETTGETTLGKAKTEADRLIQKHRNKHLGIDDSAAFGRRKSLNPNTIAALAEAVLLEHTPTVRVRTQVSHRRYLGPKSEIVEEWGECSADAVTVPGVTAWINRLRSKKFDCGIPKGERGYHAPRLRVSFEGFTKHLNLLFRHAFETGRIKHLLVFSNPDKKLISKRKGRRYSDEELQRLWAEMNEDMRDQFVLASECYMRLNEALALEWARVDLKTGLVTLEAEHVKTGSKTGRGRTFYLSEFALERVRARWEACGKDSPYIFPSRFDVNWPRLSNRSAWIATKARAGIEGKATWHHLRHTALSRALLESGANPVKVSEYAGVHMVTIQKTYLHSRPEETREVSSGAVLPLLKTTQKRAKAGRTKKVSKRKVSE